MSAADQLKKNRDLMFWALHTMGWSAYGIAQYLSYLLYDKHLEYGTIVFIAALSGFVLSAPLRYVCRRLWTLRPLLMIGGALVAAYATALAWRVVINGAHRHFMEPWLDVPWFDYFRGVLSATYLMVCWMGLYFGFRYYESTQQERERALRASALAQEAQVKMLRYQLNPHFLFNTLNAISTLILDNRNAVANSAVTGLSEFLRYTLDQDPMKKVTVAQELEALNLYLEIEKMRFGARLTIEYDLDERARRALIPSLLLQPLIENAIKYAVSPREQGGCIRISGRVEHGTVRLEVADDGPGMVDAARIANGRGVGIRNTRERLQVLYGERSAVSVFNGNPGLRVALSFPCETLESPDAPTSLATGGLQLAEVHAGRTQ